MSDGAVGPVTSSSFRYAKHFLIWLKHHFRSHVRQREASIYSSFSNLSIRIALIAVLTLLLSGWTCSALFISCHGVGSQLQISSLLPAAIPNDTESVVLLVHGSGFTPHSQIRWNGNTMRTTFMDSQYLQTTINQQTFESFGGSAGESVQISVSSRGSTADSGCPIVENSAALALVIN